MIEIDPNGNHVLIEVMKIEQKTKSGLIVSTGQNAKWEEGASGIGVIKKFGPLAFHGIEGCDPSGYPPDHPRFKMAPHEIWGVNVGDQVEFHRTDGKKTEIKSLGNVRYIPDTCILGKVTGNLELDGGQV